jgi:predicted PurR-regulated permease PerM
VCLCFFLLYLLQSVFFLLFVGIVLATALRPLINATARLGFSHSTSVSLVYAVLAVVLLGAIIGGLPLLVDQLSAMVAEVPKYYEHLRTELLRVPSDLVRRAAKQLPEKILIPVVQEPVAGEPASEQVPTHPGLHAVTQALSYGQPVMRTVLAAGAVLLLAFYWSLQEDRTLRGILMAVPTAKRDSARELLDSILKKVGAYLRGQGILCLVVGSMNLVAFLIIGLPNAVSLGVLAGVCEAVPMFGPVLGAIPAMFVALSVDPSKVLWVIVAAGLIQQAENYLLVPRVMDKSVGVNPVVTLLAIAGFGSILGFAGAILAIPLAAIIQVLLDRFVLSGEALEPPKPEGRDAVSLIRYQARELIHDARMLTRRQGEEQIDGDPIEEELEAIALDLDRALPEPPPPAEPATVAAAGTPQ